MDLALLVLRVDIALLFVWALAALSAGIVGRFGATTTAAPVRPWFETVTPERARAYTRVMNALQDLDPAKQALTRRAADALLFCIDVLNDRCARAAVLDFEAMHAQLIASGRWTRERAAALADDVWACGPGLGTTLRTAA